MSRCPPTSRKATSSTSRTPARTPRPTQDRKSTRLNSSHTVIYTLSLHDALPTCDSVDVVMRDEPLPSDLQEGDFIYIKNAGAYTTAYASQFNGFPLPEVRVFESKTDRDSR